jgi:hypothetical protein
MNHQLTHQSQHAPKDGVDIDTVISEVHRDVVVDPRADLYVRYGLPQHNGGKHNVEVE